MAQSVPDVAASSVNGSYAWAAAAPPDSNTLFTDATCANNPNCFYSLDWDTTQKYLFIYHLFSLLWIYQFVIGFG